MTNLQKLTSIIQELIPEVMELKFGCEIKIYGIGRCRICKELVDNNFELEILEENRKQQSILYSKNILELDRTIEILGSPITIAIVLRALAKKYEDWEYAITLSGEIIKMKRNNENGFAEFEGTGIFCNLAQDDLTLQSEETITNLLKIFEV